MAGIKNTGHINLVYHAPVHGTYVHMCEIYGISMIKPMARRAVDR